MEYYKQMDSMVMVPGMCYVPWQRWAGLYNLDVAILKGTLFEVLDKPFLGGCR